MKRRTLVESNFNRRPVSPEHPRPAAHPMDADNAGARRAKPEATRHYAILSGLEPELDAEVTVEVLTTVSSVRGQA